MKKIYIAGCGGMLGKAFKDVFSKDYQLKCTDIDLNEAWLSLCDFRNKEEYQKDILDFAPDYLFHLGALTDLEYCEKNIDDAQKSNAESVKYATEIANQLNIPLLYISTAGIYDGKQDIYTEEDIPVPLSVYAKTKYEGEQFVKENAKDYLVCRAGWMMGGGFQKDKKFINKILKQILNGQKELFIVNDKSGTPTYTIDFARNVKLLVEKAENGLYNMVCEGLTDRLEVCTELLKILNLQNKITLTEVNSSYFKGTYSAPRPRSERLINKNLNEKNFNIMRDWKICLKEYIKNDFSSSFNSTNS